MWFSNTANNVSTGDIHLHLGSSHITDNLALSQQVLSITGKTDAFALRDNVIRLVSNLFGLWLLTKKSSVQLGPPVAFHISPLNLSDCFISITVWGQRGKKWSISKKERKEKHFSQAHSFYLVTLWRGPTPRLRTTGLHTKLDIKWFKESPPKLALTVKCCLHIDASVLKI